MDGSVDLLLSREKKKTNFFSDVEIDIRIRGSTRGSKNYST